MKRFFLCSMMIVSFFIAPVCAESPARKAARQQLAQKRSCPMRKLYSSYLASLILSGCVGATTGSVVRYIEQQLPLESSPVAVFLALLAWLLESEFRNDIIAALQQDLGTYQVAYKRGLMFKTAWIASWIAYLRK